MPLIWIGAGWLAGIWAAFTFDLPAVLFAAALVVPIAGFILWRDRRARLLWAAAFFALLGGARAAVARPVFGLNDLATYNDRGAVTVVGVIDDYPDRRDTFVNLRLRAETLALPDAASMPILGTLLVRGDRLADFRYGDRIEVTGPIQTPPEFSDFSYRDYLAVKGIYSVSDRPRIEVIERDQGSPVFAALFSLKDRARDTIAAVLPEPEAALLTGILLGDDSGLPESVKDDFRLTGTSHIIAISGYNFAILLALASVPAIRLFGRRRAVPILLLAVLAYTMLVGASASVVRAAIMGALTLIAGYLGRQTLALNSLFVAAILMTLLDPFTLGDVGFQLSFASTLGLVLYTRPLQNAAERGLSRWVSASGGSASGESASGDASYKDRAKKIVDVLSDIILVTLAAQITTLPILIVTFRQVSLLTLFVNALVLPAQTGVMVFGGLALLAGMVFLPFGQIIGWAAWLFLAWTIQVIHLFGRAPGVSIELGYVDPLWSVAYYAALAALTVWFTHTPEQRMDIKTQLSKVSPRIALPALGITLLLAALALSWRPDGKLHVHALNVDGMPVFVQTPTGRQILIGGSNSPSALLAALGARMPFWDRDLDLVVVPKTDAKALNGLLAVVDRYHVGQIVSVEVGDHRAAREWLDLIAAKQIEVIEPGLEMGIEDGLSLSLDESGWVRIEAGATSVGLGQPAHDAHVDVLVLNEMADGTSERLQSMQPSIVVTWEPVEPLEGVVVVSAQQSAVELLFDGTQWEARASP